MLPKIAILLVVTNEAKHIPSFFSHLKSQTYEGEISVYILDNNSSDNSPELVMENWPEADITLERSNIGFARGNNIIAKKAFADGADYIFVLNPDVELDPDCIKILVELGESDSKTGIVSPVLFWGNELKDEEKIQHFGKNINFSTLKLSAPFVNKKTSEISLPETNTADFAGGGITMMKRELFEITGLFDEDNYIYGEEPDLAYRVRKTGYKTVISSKAKSWHNHDYSRKNKNGNYFQYYYINRARYLFFWKYRLYSALLLNVFKDLIKFPLYLRWALKIADFKLLRYFYSGIFAGLRRETGKATLRFD